MPDFTLDQLTEIWVERLAPLVYSDKYGGNVPVYIVYDDVMLVMKQAKERGGEKDRDFYEAVMGKDTIEESNPEYNETSMVLDLGGIVGYAAWKQISMDDRARIRAQRILYGMVQVIGAYRKEQERMVKERQKGGKS